MEVALEGAGCRHSGSAGTGPGPGVGPGGAGTSGPPGSVLAPAARRYTAAVGIRHALSVDRPADIPMRDWLYGRLLIRKFVTATVAPAGVGKSSLIAAEALAQVSGKDIARG